MKPSDATRRLYRTPVLDNSTGVVLCAGQIAPYTAIQSASAINRALRMELRVTGRNRALAGKVIRVNDEVYALGIPVVDGDVRTRYPALLATTSCTLMTLSDYLAGTAVSGSVSAIVPNGFAQRGAESSTQYPKLILEGVFTPDVAQGWVAVVGSSVLYIDGITASPLGYQEVYTTRTGVANETVSVAQVTFDPATGAVTQGTSQTRRALPLPHWLEVDSYAQDGDTSHPGDLVIFIPGSALAGGSVVLYNGEEYRVIRAQPSFGATGYLVRRSHNG